MSTLLHRATPRVAASEMVAASGVAAVGAAFVLSPDHIEDGPIICPFRLLTGRPCPGCGLTRSWVYGAHGQWSNSFASHPFGMLLVAVLLTLAVAVVVARVRRLPAPDLNRWAKHPVTLGIAAAWLTFAVVRLVTWG